MSTIYILSTNKKNITIFHMKIIVCTAVKNCCILHGHVCVMSLFQAHEEAVQLLKSLGAKDSDNAADR